MSGFRFDDLLESSINRKVKNRSIRGIVLNEDSSTSKPALREGLIG